jgi:hypothetical protein
MQQQYDYEPEPEHFVNRLAPDCFLLGQHQQLAQPVAHVLWEAEAEANANPQHHYYDESQSKCILHGLAPDCFLFH